MKWYVSILLVVVSLFTVGAIAQEQAMQAPELTPEQGLNILWQAAGSYKADRNEQALIQQSAATIERALAIYRQYVPVEVNK